jgi:hypothetical protein
VIEEWCNTCHPCAQTSSVIWQHRNAPRWAWREIRRHVVQVTRGRGHSSGLEQRTNIKFCFKLGKTAAETVEMMRQVYGDNCLSRAQIFRRYARSKTPEVFSDHAICMFHSNIDILHLLGTFMAITALLSCQYFTNYFQACFHIYFVIHMYICKSFWNMVKHRTAEIKNILV